MAEPGGAACVGVSPGRSSGVDWGRWEFASHALGMPGGKGGCAGGKHIRCLDNAIPAMNQKNSFAAMTGRGLGHSPKCMSREKPSTAAGSPASQLVRCAAQRLGTCILGLNLSLPSLRQSH